MNTFTDAKPVPNIPRDSPEFPPPQRPLSIDSPSSITQRQYPWSEGDERRLSEERFGAEDFGTKNHSDSEPIYDKVASEGRFATFPAKGRSSAAEGYALLDPLPLQSRHDLGPSFASSIAEALDHTENLFVENNNHSISSSLLDPPSQAEKIIVTTDTDRGGVDDKAHRRNLSDNDEVLLAYMNSADEDSGLTSRSRTSFQSLKNVSLTEEVKQRQGNVDEESEKEKVSVNSATNVSHEFIQGDC